MKIKAHLKNAFTSPLGNFLAIANLILFSLGHIALSRSEAFWKLVFDLNRPAIITDWLLNGEFLVGLLLPPLIYLQWIYIGWLARVIARKIQPPIH